MNQLPRNISSLEVAKMVGRDHKNVMRDITTILGQLDELKIEPISYFIESEYKDSLNRLKPKYLLTKQGCELYGNRMTGIDGTAFSVKYIERFNEMEQQVNRPSYEIGDPVARAKKWIEEQEEKLALTAVIEEQKPMVMFATAIVGSSSSILIRELAILLKQNGIDIGQGR